MASKTGTLPEDQCLKYLAEYLFEWEMLQTILVEKIEAHILCLNFFFL